MNLLRSLLALLLAISVASPACCCTLKHAEETVQAHHCCGGKKEDPKTPEACDCTAKNPKQLEDPPCLPGAAVALLPPVLPAPLDVPLPAAATHEAAPPDFHSDTGPPRLRLALWQRFLI